MTSRSELKNRIQTCERYKKQTHEIHKKLKKDCQEKGYAPEQTRAIIKKHFQGKEHHDWIREYDQIIASAKKELSTSSRIPLTLVFAGVILFFTLLFFTLGGDEKITALFIQAPTVEDRNFVFTVRDEGKIIVRKPTSILESDNVFTVLKKQKIPVNATVEARDRIFVELAFQELQPSSFSLDIEKPHIELQEIAVASQQIVTTYAINIGETTYTKAVLTQKAKGTELYSCSAWDFETESCSVEWYKERDIQPGEEYTVELTANQMAYAETGLATINTRKSLYRPEELVEFVMVVLDTEGHLVSEAEVTVSVYDPSGDLTELSGQSIRESSAGIYEAEFDATEQEGNYTIRVTAEGTDVNSSLSSYFTVKDFYEFDIVRSSPATTNPWDGPFNSSIIVDSLIQTERYNFTEVLPAQFVVTNKGGGKLSQEGSTQTLTWTNLPRNAEVAYSAQPPLLSPDLYILGLAYVDYEQNGAQKRFTEGRPWYLAIDPANPSFGGMNFSIWESSSWTWDSGTHICSVLLSDDDATISTCVENPLVVGRTYRTQVQLTELGGGGDVKIKNAADDYVDLRGVIGFDTIFGENASLVDTANCVTYDQAGDNKNGQIACNVAISAGTDVRITNPSKNEFLAASGGGSWEGFQFIITVGENASLNDTGFWYVDEDKDNIQQSSRINVSTVELDTTAPVVTLVTPSPGTIDTDGEILFEYNVTDLAEVVNCSLIVDDAIVQTDMSITTNITQNFTQVLANGSYTWSVNCTDYQANVGNSTSRLIHSVLPADNETPLMTLIAPPNLDLSLTGVIDFQYNVSDIVGIANCSLTIDGVVDQIAYNVPRNTTNTFNKIFSADDVYEWNVTCVDASSNSFTTTSQFVNVTILVRNYVMLTDTLSKDSLWLETIVVNPSADTLAISEVTFDILNPTMAWTGVDAGEDPNGNGATFWSQSGEDLIWSGSVYEIPPYSAAHWKVQATGDKGGGAVPTTITTSVTSDIGSFSNVKTVNVGDDTAIGMFYNAVDDLASVADYDAGDFQLLHNTSGDPILPNVNHDFQLYLTEISNKAGDSGGTLTIRLPSSFSIVDVPTTQTDWSGIVIGGGGTSDWQINATLDIGMSGEDVGFTFNATPPLSINNESYLLETNFSFGTNKGGSARAITEAVVRVLEDDYPIITAINHNATLINGSYLVRGNGAIRLNASITDDFGVSTVLFTVNGSNFSATPNAPEYFFTQQCTATSQHNWTAVYANDTQNQFSSNTSVGLTWYCDADGPNAPNVDITTFAENTWLYGSSVTVLCTENGDIGQAGINSTSYHYQENSTGAFTNISACSATNTSCEWTLPADVLNVSVRCRVFDLLNQTGSWNTSSYLGIDNTAPTISGEEISNTSLELGVDTLCVNATVIDAYNSVDLVRITIAQPGGGGDVQVVLLDDGGTCDVAAGDDIYAVEFSPTFGGLHNWTLTFANDTIGNSNQTIPGLTFTVATAGNISTNMTAPIINTIINESGLLSSYTQSCSVFCQSEGPTCRDVAISARYNPGLWQGITNVTTQLFVNESIHYCGNLTANESCNASFLVTSNEGSGNNIWPIRCQGSSSNAAAGVSTSVNLTVNDRPEINTTAPSPGEWINTNYDIQCTANDADGTITGTTYSESTDNASFSAITGCVLLAGDSTSCDYDTTTSVCAENELCYFSCTAFENRNANRTAYTTARVDNTGPTASFNTPVAAEYINASVYGVNVSLNDTGVGEDHAFIEYRASAFDSWSSLCIATGVGDSYTVPCAWIVLGLPESSTYQLRARGNDTLNNNGSYVSITNVVINLPPNVTLISPTNDSSIQSGTILNFTISDDNLVETWWTSNGGPDNFTWLNGLDDIDTTGWAEGVYNITVYANDSLAGYSEMNVSHFRFTIDDTAPILTVISPVNGTSYTTTSINVNATTDTLADSIWYVLDGDTPVILCTNCNETDTTPSFDIGEHTMIVYANDSAGNTVNETITFFVEDAPRLLVMVTDTLGKDSSWLETIVINPTSDYLGVTDIDMDIADASRTWAGITDGEDPNGGGTTGWSIDGENLRWDGTAVVAPFTSEVWKVYADSNQGGATIGTTVTMIAAGNFTNLTKQKDVNYGDDSLVGVFYNPVDDTTSGPDYVVGDYFLLRNSSDERISPGYNHEFMLHVTEARGKAIFTGGDLTITIPKEFTGVTAATSQTDWNGISVSGGGASDWTIVANLLLALSNSDATFTFNATPPPSVVNTTWELDTEFDYLTDDAVSATAVTEAGLEVYKDEPPLIGSDYAINISGVQAENTDVLLNVTVTDDFGVDVVEFTYGGSTRIALQNGDEWYFVDECNATETRTWTAIFANDTIGQTDTQVLSISWSCDISAPNVPNIAATGYFTGSWLTSSPVTLTCDENGDVGLAGINASSYHYQENSSGTFTDISGCSATTDSCSWTLPADNTDVAVRCRVSDTVNHTSNWNTTSYAGIDTTAPVLSSFAPAHQSLIATNDITFNFTASDIATIDNCSLYLDGQLNVTNSSIAQGSNTIPISNIADGQHRWYLICTDENDFVTTTTERTFTIDTTPPASFDLLTPLDATVTQNLSAILTWEESVDANFENYTVELSLNPAFSSVLAVYYSFQQSLTEVNATFEQGKTYYWRVTAYDQVGLSTASSSNFSYTTDYDVPLVGLVSPSPDAFDIDGQITFTYLLSDVTNSTCSLYTNHTGSWAANLTTTSLATGTHTFAQNFSINTTILWNIACTDDVGNIAFAPNNRTLFIYEPVTGEDNQSLPVNLTVNNTAPTVDSVVVNATINLQAATTTPVVCQANITDGNGQADIAINATFNASGTPAGSPDDNNSHYTNTSCSCAAVNTSSQSCSCSFFLESYADPGAWTCTVNAFDASTETSANTDSFVNTLLALFVANNVLDYGDMGSGEISAEQNVTVYNYGNTIVNVSLFGYAQSIGDALAMNCTLGDITVGQQRFSTVSSTPFASMTPLSGNPSSRATAALAITKPTSPVNQSENIFWRLQPLAGSFGECSGTVVFQAEAS